MTITRNSSTMCPRCYEPVTPGAQRCPHCRYHLGYADRLAIGALWSVAVVVTTVFLVAFVGALLLAIAA